MQGHTMALAQATSSLWAPRAQGINATMSYMSSTTAANGGYQYAAVTRKLKNYSIALTIIAVVKNTGTMHPNCKVAWATSIHGK